MHRAVCRALNFANGMRGYFLGERRHILLSLLLSNPASLVMVGQLTQRVDDKQLSANHRINFLKHLYECIFCLIYRVVCLWFSTGEEYNFYLFFVICFIDFSKSGT